MICEFQFCLIARRFHCFEQGLLIVVNWIRHGIQLGFDGCNMYRQPGKETMGKDDG